MVVHFNRYYTALGHPDFSGLAFRPITKYYWSWLALCATQRYRPPENYFLSSNLRHSKLDSSLRPLCRNPENIKMLDPPSIVLSPRKPKGHFQELKWYNGGIVKCSLWKTNFNWRENMREYLKDNTLCWYANTTKPFPSSKKIGKLTGYWPMRWAVKNPPWEPPITNTFVSSTWPLSRTFFAAYC